LVSQILTLFTTPVVYLAMERLRREGTMMRGRLKSLFYSRLVGSSKTSLGVASQVPR